MDKILEMQTKKLNLLVSTGILAAEVLRWLPIRPILLALVIFIALTGVSYLPLVRLNQVQVAVFLGIALTLMVSVAVRLTLAFILLLLKNQHTELHNLLANVQMAKVKVQLLTMLQESGSQNASHAGPAKSKEKWIN